MAGFEPLGLSEQFGVRYGAEEYMRLTENPKSHEFGIPTLARLSVLEAQKKLAPLYTHIDVDRATNAVIKSLNLDHLVEPIELKAPDGSL